MTDTTNVKPGEKDGVVPCAECDSTEHTTTGHFEGNGGTADTNGHFEGNGVGT